jgi:hypothetical protein
MKRAWAIPLVLFLATAHGQAHETSAPGRAAGFEGEPPQASAPESKYVEREIARYAEAARGGRLFAEEHEYWKMRVELAHRIDAGELTTEGANKLEATYRERLTRRAPRD